MTADRITGDIRTTLRHDSAHKHVAGSAVYVDDIPTTDDTLVVLIGQSPHAHARITGMDLSAVAAADGVVAVLTHADIPGVNDCSPVYGDDPVLAENEVSYVGQAVFAIVAETMRAARDALPLANVSYETLSAILTIDEAMKAGSWLGPSVTMESGSPDTALAGAQHTLSGRIEIGGQEHFYLEGQAALAIPGEDRDMTLHCSTQHPSEIQHKVADCLGLPNHAVTVETRRMGGAFGGKESQGNLPAILSALAAHVTGRPAKTVYDRDDDFMLTGKRHDFRIDYSVGFDGEGRIEAVIDGGPCAVGVESSIVGLGGAPVLLRPGGVPAEALEAALGGPLARHEAGGALTAPGQLVSHYAPGARVRLNATQAVPGEVLLGFGPMACDLNLSETGDLVEAAANLFRHLHTLDRPGIAGIAVAPIPDTGLGVAINDRLRRAAAPRG